MNNLNPNGSTRNKVNRAWQAIKNYFLPPRPEYVSRDTDLNALLIQGRDRILTVMLRLASLIGVVTILAIMDDLLQRQRWGLVVVYLTGMVTFGIISHLRQISYKGRALTFLAILYA